MEHVEALELVGVVGSFFSWSLRHGRWIIGKDRWMGMWLALKRGCMIVAYKIQCCTVLIEIDLSLELMSSL